MSENVSKECCICKSNHRVSQYKDTKMYYCCKHYNQMKKYDRIVDDEIKEKRKPKKCDVCDNIGKNIIEGKRYCNKHYAQIKRYGNILKETTKDKNEITIKDNYAEIIIKNQELIEIARAIIDVEDVDFAKQYKWHCDKQKYVCTRINRKNYKYHRLLLNPPKEKVVDHKNGNPLDNRKEKWEVKIGGVSGGMFSNIEDAIKVRKNLENKFGYYDV